MSKLAMLLAAGALTASPATAQHTGHSMPGMSMPMPAPKKAQPKKPAKKKAATKSPAPKKAVRKAGARKPVTTKPAARPAERHTIEAPADPHAGHSMQMEPTIADPHAGHQMPVDATDPHAGHDMDAMAPAGPQPAPAPADALGGPAHAADAIWGQQAMSRSRNVLRSEHGGMVASKFLVDRAEARFGSGADGYLMDMQAWTGGDIDKLWLKSEIEGDWGHRLEHAEVHALWSHAVDPWFDIQVGIRQDLQAGPNRTHLAVGVQGLAPYWWEVDGTLFLSNKGELTARAEAEYDLRITQKLILQPRLEASLSAQDVPELRIGSGLASASAGARLRYQFAPTFAPYVGIEYERAFGRTRDYQRVEVNRPGSVNVLVGFRAWF